MSLRIIHFGLALRAIHDSEDVTGVVGVNSTLLKVMMLLGSAFMTGDVGGAERALGAVPAVMCCSVRTAWRR